MSPDHTNTSMYDEPLVEIPTDPVTALSKIESKSEPAKVPAPAKESRRREDPRRRDPRNRAKSPPKISPYDPNIAPKEISSSTAPEIRPSYPPPDVRQHAPPPDMRPHPPNNPSDKTPAYMSNVLPTHPPPQNMWQPPRPQQPLQPLRPQQQPPQRHSLLPHPRHPSQQLQRPPGMSESILKYFQKIFEIV